MIKDWPSQKGAQYYPKRKKKATGVSIRSSGLIRVWRGPDHYKEYVPTLSSALRVVRYMNEKYLYLAELEDLREARRYFSYPYHWITIWES